MLEKILEFERELFFLINSSYSPFWDQVMWLYSGIYIWIPFILFFCFMLLYKKKWQEWVPVFASILLVSLLCMVFSSYITKPYFARPRPVFHPSFMENVRTLYESIKEPYGFISGHSASTFGIATISALIFRNKLYTCVVFIWASVMAYSRIYLGMHFISDIVAGALAGIAFGYVVYLLYKKYTEKELIDYTLEGKVIGISLLGYILLFTITSSFLVKFFF